MKDGWEVKKLGDVVLDLHQGLNTAGYKIKFYDKGYPIIQTRNLDNGVIDLNDKIKYMSEDDWLLYKNKYKPNIGDVFLTNIGTIGKTAVVTEENDYLIHWNIFIFKLDKEKLNSFYLKLFLDTPFCSDYYTSFQKGGTVNFITKKMIENLMIPLPPLPEQQRIVAILDQAISVIAQAKENAEKNLANAKELFESYLQSVFANKGDGWEEKRFDEICVLQRGFDLPTQSRNEGVFPLVSSNGITDRIDLWKVKSPGVVTGRSGTIGNVHFIEENYWPLNTALYIKEFHGNYERFVYYFLKQFDLGKYSSGAGVPTLNRNNVHSERVWFPKATTIQKQIVAKLDALSAECKKLEAVYQQKIAGLEELKKSILHKAFRGELLTTDAHR